MAIKVNHDSCIVCGACIDSCPTNALSLAEGAEPRLLVDEPLCAECSACIPTCSVEALAYGSEAVERKHDKQAIPDIQAPPTPRHDSPPRPATVPDAQDQEEERFSLTGWRPGSGKLRRALRRRRR